MKRHLFLDANVLVDIAVDNPATRVLQRELSQALRTKQTVVLHLSAHACLRAARVLELKYNFTARSAMTVLATWVHAAGASGGYFDAVDEMSTSDGVHQLREEATRNGHLDKRGELEIEDEGLLRALQRTEAVLGHQVALVSNDARCREEWSRRGGIALSIREVL